MALASLEAWSITLMALNNFLPRKMRGRHRRNKNSLSGLKHLNLKHDKWLKSLMEETMKGPHMVVFVTTSSKDEAEKIARSLLNERLIACANIIGPVQSFFWWQGKIETAQEHLILMKTRKDLFSKLSERVKALHSYQIPEIIATPIIEGLKQYMEWLESSLRINP